MELFGLTTGFMFGLRPREPITMFNEHIQEGFGVFASEHGQAFGAVRQINTKPTPSIIVYVENAGDFVIQASAVIAVHLQKVIVDPAKLDPRLRSAIGHAHDAEDPTLG